MADPVARQTAEAADWPGLLSSLGTQVKALGAGAVQVNLQSNVAGEMHVRPGLRVVRFENETVSED